MRLRRRYGRAARRPKFTVEPGRQIYRDGAPFISIGREGSTIPATADEATHVIAACLQRKGFRGKYDR